MGTFWSDRIALITAALGVLFMALTTISLHDHSATSSGVLKYLSDTPLGISGIVLCLPVWTLCISAYMLVRFPTGMEYVVLSAVMIFIGGTLFFFIGKLISFCVRGICNKILGSSRQRMKWKLILTVLLAIITAWVLSVALPICIMLFDYTSGYWMDKLPIKAGIYGITGCTPLEITGNEDTSLEHITAKIRVKGKGLIVLSELEPESFHDVGHLRLHQIDMLKVRQDSYGYMGVSESATGKPKKSHAYSEWIDIGTEGPYAEKFPFQIRSVQDAIKHFNDIHSAMSTWPRKPNIMTVTTTNEEICNVSIIEEDSDKKEIRTTP